MHLYALSLLMNSRNFIGLFFALLPVLPLGPSPSSEAERERSAEQTAEVAHGVRWHLI